MRRAAVLLFLLSLFPAATAPRAQADSENLQLGTWVMNIPKSTFSAGTNFKSAVSRIEAVKGGIKHTLNTVYGDGTSRQYEYTSAYDGKEVPVIGNSPWGDTVAISRIDAHSSRTIYRKAGAITVTQISVVSNDGKMRTVTVTGTSPAGQPVHNVSVYDKKP